MTRLVAVAILPLALLLPGLVYAEEWTQGTLSLSWDVPPPDNVDWGVSFDASASACYDPNLPEGTQWVWMNSSFTFEWSLPPEASYNWTSSYNHTTATVSFCELDDPCGEQTIAVTVDFGGQIHVNDGQAGRTLDIQEAPVTCDFDLLLAPAVKIDTAEGHGFGSKTAWPKCQVKAAGSAAPLNGTLTVEVLWCNDAQERLVLNPPPTSFSPVDYGPGWSLVFGT